jgi:sugar phosphate isomerase/epimerase
MKFAICNELYGDWSLDKAFAHAAKTGYTGIEIAPFTLAPTVFDVTPEMRLAVRETAEKHQLEIIGLHWLLAKTTGLHLTSPDPAIRERTTEYLGELAKLCRDLGGDLMVFGSPPQRNLADGVSPQQGFEFAVEVFRSLAPTLESCGVTLALEPLGPEEGNFMLTAEAGIEIAQAVGSPNVRLHLDVKAMSTESKPIPEIIRDSRDWIHHFHANDPNRRGPGMGDVDYVPIFEALDSIGYDGWVSVEVFDYEPGIDALAGDSLNYMKRVLGI